MSLLGLAWNVLLLGSCFQEHVTTIAHMERILIAMSALIVPITVHSVIQAIARYVSMGFIQVKTGAWHVLLGAYSALTH